MPLVEAGPPSQISDEALSQLIAEGPTLPVDIGFDAEYDPRQATPPQPQSRQVPALIDTGATFSCIDTDLARNIGLPVVGRTQIAGVGGPQECDVYLAQIRAPDLAITQYGRFSGVRLAAGGQPLAALLGRSFLRNFIMIYDGPRAQVTLAR